MNPRGHPRGARRQGLEKDRMEKHIERTQGKHLNRYRVLWYPSKCTPTLVPAQTDGCTNTCHGEGDAGMDLAANVNLHSTTEIIGTKSICTFIGFGKSPS